MLPWLVDLDEEDPVEIVENVADQLAEAHRRVLDALLDGDCERLGELVADDCRIVGPKGFLIGKQERTDAHHSGVDEQVRLEVEHTELTMRNDVAVRCDLQRSERLFRGETDETWQLVGIQYTAVAPEAA
jgi:uncharacterized protein DUF4440